MLKKISALMCLSMSICVIGGCGDNNSSNNSDNSNQMKQENNQNTSTDNGNTQYDNTNNDSREATDEQVIECALDAMSDVVMKLDIMEEIGDEGYVVFQNANDLKSIKYTKLSEIMYEKLGELNFNAPKEDGKSAFKINWFLDDSECLAFEVTTITADELVAITDEEAKNAQKEDEKFVEELKKKENQQ